MCKVNERFVDYQLKVEDMDEEPFSWDFDTKKAKAKLIDSNSFLYVPDTKKDNSGKTQYASELHNAINGEQIPYWYAFLEPPHKTKYKKADFVKINNVLFPNGAKSLEVYEWTTDWSNYFDAGHEWWGTACWSVYDRSLNRYVVIMASTTD